MSNVTGNDAIGRTLHPDIAHLDRPKTDQPYEITAAHFVRLAEYSALPFMGEMILFGIRGAKLLNDDEAGCWKKSIQLVEITPNHKDFCCILGIWNRKTHRFALFTGSTVPHRAWLNRQLENPLVGIANHLAIGLYQYAVGAHEPEGREKEEGAFRQSRLQPVPVWRLLTKDATLDEGGASFDLSIVNDHIHSAQSESQPTGISFSSAGCQVIGGDHQPPNLPTGDYQHFRILAGQSAYPHPAEVGLPYQYLLLHARHFSAIADGFSKTRYFHGSRHYDIRLIQERLIELNWLDENRIDKGYYNGATTEAVYRFQVENGLLADGIIKEKDLKKLALNIERI